MGVAGKLLEKLVVVLPQTRPAVMALYNRYAPKEGWGAQHPFDQMHGVETSGFVPAFLLHASATMYGAAQPSIIEAAMATIPNPGDCHFVDLGCGKGRPLIIAAKAGFKTVTGVEFTPTLAQVARKNAAIYARSNPSAPPIEVVTGDALEYQFPDAPTVLYLYNPFDGDVTARVLKNIEISLQNRPRDFYVICYNPVHANLFDASPAFERRYAAQLLYDKTELDFGPDDSDGIAVWQNRGNPAALPPGTPSAPIIVTKSSGRAEIQAPPA
jgi:SAM-dependent methyltransferase